MKTTVSEPQSWKRVISVEVPDQDIQTLFNEKLKKVRQDIKLPGFRQGKVPESLVKQRFGESIRAEIIDTLIQDSYKKACEEHKIVPVSAPKVVNYSAETGKALVFSIESEIDPEIDITGYENLKIKVAPQKIKDADIDAAMDNIRDRLAEFKDVERSVKKGDYIKIEYIKVVVDGEERTDIKNPQHPVEVGGNDTLKDFYKGIIGHNAGETVDLSIKFPKDYSETNVAGKTGEFSIKIISVQEKIVPEINEDFLKKVGNFADESALREKIRTDMENDALTKAKEEAHQKAIDKLIATNSFEVPPARIDQFAEYMHNEALKYARQGTPSPSREEIAEKYHDLAIKTIKRDRIIQAVANKEHIKPTQAEVDQEIATIAATYQQDFETLKQTLRKNGAILRIRNELKERKTLDYLIGEYTPEKAETP